MKKVEVIQMATKELLNLDTNKATHIITSYYPFQIQQRFSRNYTIYQKMKVFIQDGFIDRYTGDKLVIPGILKILSTYFPKEFPYQKNWKMTECHVAYWELTPTVDHLYPIARGGEDKEENWITTSMLHNSIKSNWTLEEVGWKLHDRGDLKEWDGLTNEFITLVKRDEELLKDSYIRDWYNAVVKYS